MKLRVLLIFGLLFFLVTPEIAEAQRRRGAGGNASSFRGFKKKFGKHRRYNAIGVSVNAFNYFGDIVPTDKIYSTDISFTQPGIGLIFKHRFGPRYELKSSLTFGTLRGDDFESADPADEDGQFRYIRNLHFRNNIKELSVEGVFDLFENQGTLISRVKFTPYAFFGVVAILHNPQAQDANGDWTDLQPLGTEGQLSDLYPERKKYSKFAFAIPLGLGIRYKVNQNIDFAFEIGYRQTFTDYLDDVSLNYASPTAFADNPAGAFFADRSRETNAIVSGDPRNLSAIPAASRITNVGGVDYITGYGYDPTVDFGNSDPKVQNLRGNADENDVYIVTSIQLTYIIGKNYRRAKFR